MKIDLTSIDVFADDSLDFDKKITFIYGKNGTGKSTVANELQRQLTNYDVSVFQGFNNVIDDSHRLNAVVLGKENAQINRQIEEKEKNIKSIESKIADIKETITEPSDGSINFWSRRKEACERYKSAQKKLDDFYVRSASAIKNLKDPQVASTTYNKNDFQSEMPVASLISEKEENDLLAIIKSEIKEAPHIPFPTDMVDELIISVEDLLTKTVKESAKIPRIENNPDKRLFAETGLSIHKKGDVCAFCGNLIDDNVFAELESFFSASDIKEFQDQIDEKIIHISSLQDQVKMLAISKENFYPQYYDEATVLNSKLEFLKLGYEKFFSALKELLDEKKKYLFEQRSVGDLNKPSGFSAIKNEYESLRTLNNNNDLKQKKKDATNRIRYHKVKQLMDEFNYEAHVATVNALNTEKERCEREFQEQKGKIDGPNGLNDEITSIRREITKLLEGTKDEITLTKHINAKLKHIVSFELVHVPDTENKGYYNVKSLINNREREVTALSTGEKNIIAFLYFIEKLNELSENSPVKPRIIVFDDPMNSNDDGMQYLIIEELQSLMDNLRETDYFVLLTHNKHFYINVRYGHKYKNDRFIRFVSNGITTSFVIITKEDDDFKTSYESLWHELKLLYKYDVASPDALLNPIRRIIETYTKFNAFNKNTFYGKVPGAKKLFDVNSHSIDDVEAELNGKSKGEIIRIVGECFARNNCGDHFISMWKDAELNETGDVVIKE